MLFNLFSLIELILRLFKLWDQFSEYVVSVRNLEEQKRQQELNKAVDATENVQTPEEAYNAQKDIGSRLP